MSIEDLKKCGIETPFFTLKGVKTYGKVVKITDGDTLCIVLPLFDKYYKFNTRLSGIDTCEIHSKNSSIKEIAIKAKNRIADLIEDCSHLLWVECYEFDKYGRLLADVFLSKDGKSISSVLLEEKLAYKYDGSTKLTEDEQLNFLS